MDRLSEVREKLQRALHLVDDIGGNRALDAGGSISEALALLDGEQGKRITGFVREIGSSRQLFQFHVRQSNPKEIPYEGPMDAAILILDIPTESEET